MARVAAPGLRVAITDHLGRPLGMRALPAWLRRVAPPALSGDVTIALVSDRRIRALNARFRRRDSVTDVLSFPHSAGRVPRSARGALGDIVISTDAARRQAGEAGHSYATELKVLALHGLLHLLGYDHDSPRDGGRMARLERRLRAQGGLHEGLIERADAPRKGRARRPAKNR